MLKNIISILVFFFLSINAAHSSELLVSINPMSCTPVEDNSETQIYVRTAGRVKLKKGAIGSVTFICQFPSFDRAKFDNMGLYMDYYNETNQGSITTSITRIDRKTGAKVNVRTVNGNRGGQELVGTALDSFISAQSTLISGGDSDPKHIDFEKYAYYVSFNLRRDVLEKFGRVDDVSGGTLREAGMAILNIGIWLRKA